MNNKDTEGLYVKCPNCGASYVYLVDKIASGGFFQCQNCAKWLRVLSQPEQGSVPVVSIALEKEAAAHERRSRPKQDFRIGRDLPTMFMHGLLFLLVMLALIWIWAYIIQLGTLLGGVIGFYAGIIVTCMGIVGVVGYTDIFLAQNFWDIYCKKSWRGIMGHGAIMSVLVLLGALPATIAPILLAHLSLEVYAVIETSLIVLYWGTVGAIGRSVAYLFVIDKDHQSGGV